MTVYERLNKIETELLEKKSKELNIIQKTYEQAVKKEDKERAAESARALRNILLYESDSEMVFDRLHLDTSNIAKFIKSITDIFNNDWAKYRQALRDIPQQEGFPFNVIIPQKPEEINK